MRKWCLAVLLLLTVLIVAVVLWTARTGTVSVFNYDRIRPGMSIAEVDMLLGGPGIEISESQLPGIVDRSVPVDHPKRVKPVVTGERYIRWEHGHSYVVVSLRGKFVAEKWYYVPSL
jgi:hypothetical protein